VLPIQPNKIFGKVSKPFCTLDLLTSVKNFTEIVPGEPLCLGLNGRRVAKYCDVGHVEGYIFETVQDTASGTIND